jgi:galactokinase
MIESVAQGFASKFGDADGVVVAMAPGRVNLIGEYTPTSMTALSFQ